MNRFSIRIAAPAFFAAALALITVSGVSAQSAPPGAGHDPAAGKTAFMKYGCYECHGTVAQGNYMGIPHLAPHTLPQGALISYIRKPSGQMPSYSATILPDKDAANIWAYLASIPTGKPYAAIPSLSSVTTKAK